MKRVVAALAAVCAVSLLLTGESAPAQRPLRVGYVVGYGATPDPNDLFGLPYFAFIRAVEKFGIEGRVLEVPPNQDPTAALSLFARQGYDLVIMGMADPPFAVTSVASEYGTTKFLLPDILWQYAPGVPKNVEGTDFRAGEAGYLAGYLAGLMEKRRPGRDVIGSVGGFRFLGVDRWIIGFEAGARRADPGIVMLKTYTNNFTTPAVCKTAALSQIAKGAGVVFNVAGECGLGTLAAAKEKGVWAVGVDVDQSFFGPTILTSAVLRLDRAVYDAIDALVRGRFRTGGNTVFDLRNGGVALGKISPKVPAAYLQRLEAVRRQIVAGRIQVPRVPG
ncbi:MAG TPA: BMP family ABC transporter substrate-binding protein [Gaiellaceae bacterium]|nr:BMP family ABC transporter substrate-binding protein [Gaiellaceae bacterium]